MKDWIKGCLKKEQYDSKTTATHAAHRAKDQYGVDLAPYKCRHCSGWHLTSKDKDKDNDKTI